MNKTLLVDGIRLDADLENTKFIAKFGTDGKCQWLEGLSTKSVISRIRSDTKGNFLLAGRFNTFFNYREDTLYTEDTFDNDALLIKIDRTGKKHWLKQFGHKGTTRYAYRTDEVAFDLVIDQKDKVILGLCLEDTISQHHASTAPQQRFVELNLLKLDENGNELLTKTMMESTNSVSAFTLTQLENGHLWLSGTTTGSTFIQQRKHDFAQAQSFLLQLNPELETKKQIWPKHGDNTIFRVASSYRGIVYFSGHFQHHLRIENLSIKNSGKHGIFLYKTGEN